MKFPFKCLFILLVFFCCKTSLFAQETTNYNFASLNSILKTSVSKINVTSLNNRDIKELNTLNEFEKSLNKKSNRKILLTFLRSLNTNQSLPEQEYYPKIYVRFANLFARLRLYPLVMKCFLKSALPYDDAYQSGYYIRPISFEKDSITGVSEDVVKDSINVSGVMAINDKDSLLLKADSGYFNHSGAEIDSKPVANYEISNPFEDGKTAVRYAMLVHIQQPVSGKRKIFIKIKKVGHTFITLIKYNSDSTYVARSFGFYPKKDNLLSATPIIPKSTAVFKNDELHDWDEVVGKFISKRRFQKILQLVKAYDCRKYNLNNNNCTDFGLNAAIIGGIKILNTYSTWPFGRGNNPAWAGQSVLEGTVVNLDTNNKDNLFIYSDLKVAN